jgi:hypothetical protein
MLKSVNEIKDKFTVEFKDKYEKVQAIYRQKHEELKKEKAEHEQWKAKVRE